MLLSVLHWRTIQCCNDISVYFFSHCKVHQMTSEVWKARGTLTPFGFTDPLAGHPLLSPGFRVTAGGFCRYVAASWELRHQHLGQCRA